MLRSELRPPSTTLVHDNAVPLAGRDDDHDELLDAIGDARFVLLGEATHGSHEFYAERHRITRRLVEEKGFDALAVEADWPDAYRVAEWVLGKSRDGDGTAGAAGALDGFRRFPNWMWRNTDVVGLLEWLREHNSQVPPDRAVGFYGLDLYSLYTSMGRVIDYLERVDPAAASVARERYGCFDHTAGDAQRYGAGTAFGAGRSCEQEVVEQLAELCAGALEYTTEVDGEQFFDAEQNARIVRDAEEYYRTMFAGRRSSWNLRDLHMADTLDDLADHLSRGRRRRAKVVVWAHNSHLGDARATDMGERGEWNLGQLLRERHAGEVFSVGFTTFTGTVTAADNWDGPSRTMEVQPALDGSIERLFHDSGVRRFMLPLRDGPAGVAFGRPMLERAIGVVYRPLTERISHWFQSTLGQQFDAVVHLDETSALEPLERRAHRGREAPETYPSKL